MKSVVKVLRKYNTNKSQFKRSTYSQKLHLFNHLERCAYFSLSLSLSLCMQTQITTDTLSWSLGLIYVHFVFANNSLNSFTIAYKMAQRKIIGFIKTNSNEQNVSSGAHWILGWYYGIKWRMKQTMQATLVRSLLLLQIEKFNE